MATNLSSPLIENRDQLLRYMESGSKPQKSSWRVGSEHEKFVFHRSDYSPLSYKGEGDKPGIYDVLTAFVDRSWQPVFEREILIAAKKDGASITLEPGGQFELSGAPLRNIHETCQETTSHLTVIKEIGQSLDIGFLGLGFHPTAERDEIPFMPKARYDIMRNYMPKVGSLGLDMMLRSCTVQVNLDFASEQDMIDKFRISLALQPLATALFANSPFKNGLDTGYQSYRSHIWTDTDKDRCGMLPFVFEKGMGFERYLDYILDIPMYFVRRGDNYIDVSGQSFRDFMQGKLPGFPGELPTMADFEDHITTQFPEVRLKTFLEMRGADGGPWSRLCALPAFWVGLLYDDQSQSEALDLIKDWSIEDMISLRDQVPKKGLKATLNGQTIHDIALRVLRLADNGLGRRAVYNAAGETEQGFLSSLHDTLKSGLTPADDLRRRLREEWGGDIKHLFNAMSY